MMVERRRSCVRRDMVLRHEQRAWGCVRIGERIRCEPCVIRGQELGPEAPLVDPGELQVARRICRQPRGDHAAVVEALLAAERRRLRGLRAVLRRDAVQMRLPSVPARGLVAAPGSRNRDDASTIASVISMTAPSAFDGGA
jgi:hypothetical protein